MITLSKKEAKYISLKETRPTTPRGSKIKVNSKLVKYLLSSNKAGEYATVGLKLKRGFKECNFVFTEDKRRMMDRIIQDINS